MRRIVEAAWRRVGDGDPRACWPLAVLFALAFGHGLLVNVGNLGWGDWDQFTARSLEARRSWLEFGQPPFWSPYHCGGVAITEDFQSRAWSPSFLFVLGFGIWWGNRLWMLLALAVGFEGARRLVRRMGAGAWGGLFAAFAIAGNGAVTSRMAIGHFGDVPYLFLPWWLLAFDSARRAPLRGALRAGLWGALCYLEAGIYPVVYGSLILFAWACAASWSERSRRPLVGFAWTMLATLGLAMHVLWPSTFFTLRTLSRDVVPEMVPPSALVEAFFSTDLSWRRLVFPEQHWRWHEYATFVGPFFVLGLLVAHLRGDRRVVGWTLLAACFVAYGLGDFATWSPWTVLHEFPVFRSMRASGRAFVPAVLCLTIAVSLTLDRSRIGPWIACALALNLALVSPAALDDAFTIEVPRVQPDPQFTQRIDHQHFRLIFREHYSLMTVDALRNHGSLSCYDPVLPEQHARVLWPAASEVLLLGTPGHARLTHWSPTRLRIDMSDVAAPGYVLVNQNHHSGWSATDGRPLTARYGVIAAPVRPGERGVEFVFRPPGFFVGALIVLLTFVVLLVATRLRPGVPRDSPSAR